MRALAGTIAGAILALSLGVAMPADGLTDKQIRELMIEESLAPEIVLAPTTLIEPVGAAVAALHTTARVVTRQFASRETSRLPRPPPTGSSTTSRSLKQIH